MNDQTLEPQQSGDMMQQVVRRSPMLGSLLGALAHTAVCWLALQLDFFRGGRIDMIVNFIVTTRLSMPVVLVALST